MPGTGHQEVVDIRISPIDKWTGQTILDMLSHYVKANQDDWDLMLPFVLFAYRTSYIDALGDNPFYLMHEREARLPLDATLVPQIQKVMTAREWRDILVERLADARQLAHDNIQAAQNASKWHYDCNVKSPQFKAGDLV